jgi:hypothetical protein
MSIELNFGLWHSGCKLSYLRYLCFKTLRHFHPNSKIQLFVGDKFSNNNHKWNNEKQDFERPEDIKVDYLEKLNELGVEVKHVDWFSQYASNYQSDIFRYWYLKNVSGFYLDTDQIILKSFEGLPLDNNFIYSAYPASSCGYYTPVGVLGASKNTEIVDFIYNNITKFVDNKNYNSAGPFMLRDVLKIHNWKDKMFNAPSNYFYPIPDSYMVGKIFDGSLKLTDESYALHIFMGHPLSQEFNKIYNKEFAEKSQKNTISRFLRENGII